MKTLTAERAHSEFFGLLHAADAEIEAGETYSLDEVFGEE